MHTGCTLRENFGRWGSPDAYVGRTVFFPITTIVTVPRVAEVLEDMYETGLLWIWEDAGAAINSEANSEGILVKSNNEKIYPIQ